MIKIPLTQNKVALIDDEDFAIVSLFKWCATKNSGIFYAVTHVEINNKQTTILMHRLILNSKPDEHTDHADLNGLNNQKCNLRKCTNSQNHMNRKSHKNTSSIYKGVSWHKRKEKWLSQIRINYKLIYLGYFNNEVDGAKAYDLKAKELFGEFARLNF